MWKITKDFEFCYGHRCHQQQLDADLSLNAPCKCRHLHGHEAKVAVTLVGTGLDHSSMVTDFNNLNFIKKFLDSYFDHKFIIDKHDPLYMAMVGVAVEDLIPAKLPGKLFLGTVPIEGGTSAHNEYLSSFTVVDFCPTSENLSRFMAEYVKGMLGNIARVESVTWHESPKSKATYYPEGV